MGAYKMTKSEFKNLYSEYRRVHREFYQHFYQANYPCGHGDYLSENFDWECSKWLDAHPIIKQVIETRYL